MTRSFFLILVVLLAACVACQSTTPTTPAGIPTMVVTSTAEPSPFPTATALPANTLAPAETTSPVEERPNHGQAVDDQAETYLGENPPGSEPLLFRAGTISTGAVELSLALHPNLQELYFTRLESGRATILVSRQGDGGWTAPEPASFSGEYDDVNPFIHPDGQSLYFSSRRPPAGSDTPRAHYQIWFVERAGAGWSDPSELALPLESAGGEMSPTLTRDGTLYYVADYPSLDGEGVYRAPLAGGEYGMPERLDFLLNTGQVVEVEPFVAPDESFLLFYSAGRPDNLAPDGRVGDLYITFRDSQGRWSEPQNLGRSVNSTGEESTPSLSPDGRYLFFASNRSAGSRLPDIYWVDAAFLPTP